MKNKPDATILKISFMSNEIVKRNPKSHETIPLRKIFFEKKIKNALENIFITFFLLKRFPIIMPFSM
jgi:hypothetical protein